MTQAITEIKRELLKFVSDKIHATAELAEAVLRLHKELELKVPISKEFNFFKQWQKNKEETSLLLLAIPIFDDTATPMKQALKKLNNNKLDRKTRRKILNNVATHKNRSLSQWIRQVSTKERTNTTCKDEQTRPALQQLQRLTDILMKETLERKLLNVNVIVKAFHKTLTTFEKIGVDVENKRTKFSKIQAVMTNLIRDSNMSTIQNIFEEIVKIVPVTKETRKSIKLQTNGLRLQSQLEDSVRWSMVPNPLGISGESCDGRLLEVMTVINSKKRLSLQKIIDLSKSSL